MQGDLYCKALLRVAAAGRYTPYRGDRLIQTISVQTNWQSAGTTAMWPLCRGDR